MMNYFRVGISLLTRLNEMLNVNQERKYIEPLLVSKRHSSTFYIAAYLIKIQQPIYTDLKPKRGLINGNDNL